LQADRKPSLRHPEEGQQQVDVLRHDNNGVKPVSIAIVVQAVPKDCIPSVRSERRWN
jgi:hypothetical protein